MAIGLVRVCCLDDDLQIISNHFLNTWIDLQKSRNDLNLFDLIKNLSL